jgi:hypothetical protein
MAVRTLAGAVPGATVAVIFAMAEDPAAGFTALTGQAPALLNAGLNLRPDTLRPSA